MILKCNNLKFSGNLLSPAHSGDVGYDVIAEKITLKGDILYENDEEIVCNSLKYIEYDTSVKLQPEFSESAECENSSHKKLYSLAFPRSSISKTNLMLANSVGVIDNGYRGHVKLRFKYMPDAEDWRVLMPVSIFKRRCEMNLVIPKSKIYGVGDKVGQLLFFEQIPVTLQQVQEVNETTRGSGGFGSTGK